MITERQYPKKILPEELDLYLSKGWYRMGQSIFTCHFLWFGDRLYSAIWLRLKLKDFSFSKKQRKILKRNKKHFQYIYRPARLTRDKEILYQKYRACFDGRLAPTLKESLQDGTDFNIYNTYEICVYNQENQLIAFSLFDVGKKSIASIQGIYDHDYAAYSLGYYTMLLEMQYGLEHHIAHYYPGYIVPGYHRFDYKKRIGDVDFFNIKLKKWQIYDKKNPPYSPLKQIELKLEHLQEKLAPYIPSKKCMYPLFEANLFGFWQAPYLEHPVFLWCMPRRVNRSYLTVVYDLLKEHYILLRCSQFDDLPFVLKDYPHPSAFFPITFIELLVMEDVLAISKSADEMVAIILGR